MKLISFVIALVLVGSSAKAQYCGNDVRPDYIEIINHSHEPSYKPCGNQSRKGWFYMQQQRIENRMETLLKKHPVEIRLLARDYVNYIEEYYYWTYENRTQFEKGLNLLYKMDKALDQVEIGQFKM